MFIVWISVNWFFIKEWPEKNKNLHMILIYLCSMLTIFISLCIAVNAFWFHLTMVELFMDLEMTFTNDLYKWPFRVVWWTWAAPVSLPLWCPSPQLHRPWPWSNCTTHPRGDTSKMSTYCQRKWVRCASVVIKCIIQWSCKDKQKQVVIKWNI